MGAYWSSLDPSQFLAQLPGIPAPVGLGWLAIERVSIEIFGNSAWALRLPPILSIYVLALCTYLLGRYWLPWWMSLLIGAALLCNAPDLVYGLQVKEDVFVSTCAVLAVLLWLGANREDATTAGRWVRYVIIGLLGVCAIPAVFAIAPLFALDLWRAWRTRQLRRQLPLIATASAIIFANLVFYVRLATAVLHINYLAGVLRTAPGPHRPRFRRAAAAELCARRLLGGLPATRPLLPLRHRGDQGVAVRGPVGAHLRRNAHCPGGGLHQGLAYAGQSDRPCRRRWHPAS